MEKQGQPEPILEPSPPQLSEEEIVERGGPWITLGFTSEDGTFDMKRVLNFQEAVEVYASLGEEIALAKSKYNIPTEGETSE